MARLSPIRSGIERGDDVRRSQPFAHLVDRRRRGGRGQAEDAGDVLRNQRHAHRPVAPQRADDGCAIANRPRRFLRLARASTTARRRRYRGRARRPRAAPTVGANAPACAIGVRPIAIGDHERHHGRAERCDSGGSRRATAPSIGSSLSWQVRRMSRNDSTIAGSVLGSARTCLMCSRSAAASLVSSGASAGPRLEQPPLPDQRSGQRAAAPAIDRPASESSMLHRAAASASTNWPPSISASARAISDSGDSTRSGRRALVHVHRRRDEPRPPQLARDAANDEVRAGRPSSRA